MNYRRSSSVPSAYKAVFAAAILAAGGAWIVRPAGSGIEVPRIRPQEDLPVPNLSLTPTETAVADAVNAPAWMGSFPTKVPPRTGRPVVDQIRAQLPTAVVSAVTGFEGIDVTWEIRNDGVRARAWILERREPDGVWRTIGSHPGSGRHHDGDVRPRTRYAYRVRAEADPTDRQWARAQVHMSPEPQVAEVVSASAFRLRFDNPQAAAEEKRGEAQVTVEKYDPVAGVVSHTFTRVFEGERIGSGRIEVESPRLNRRAMVDFDTGLTLVRVNPKAPVDYVRKYCAPTKELKCLGVQMEKLRTYVAQIQVRDVDGRLHVISRGEPLEAVLKPA